MKIMESAENYLEAIYMIKQERGFVRSIDIANRLGFSKASVSVAMKSFREEGYITVSENSNIELSENGLAIAKKMYERHHLIAKALMALGVDESTAYADSCKIEHDLSEETFEKVKNHILKSGIKF